MLRLIQSVLLGLFVVSNVCASKVSVVSVAANLKTFTISLPANPTTGYTWSVKSYDTKLLKLVKKKYRSKQTQSKSRLIGAGGFMDFDFVCVSSMPKSKEIFVSFLYARPWEKEKGELTKVKVVFTKK